MEKICTKCNQTKSVDDFYKISKKTCERMGQCISCRKDNVNKWRNNNKDKYLDYMHKWRSLNQDKYKAINKSHSIKWDLENPEYRKKKAKKRRSIDLLYRLSSNVRVLIGNSFRRKKWGKNSSSQAILGCSYEELKIHLEWTFEKRYGRSCTEQDSLHIDHVIPLCRAKTREEMIKLNHYTNLQWLLASDNLKKGTGDL